ncbi:MAG TPA: hypothetical protein VLF93_01455 [Candidatus Saccharimonadales bacterium]|nr:hypothetical protein [Candidatus Saccharimonadales bacterium]
MVDSSEFLGSGASPDAVTHIIKKEPEIGAPVKESWKAAFLQANTLWPQTTKGFRVLETAAILAHPPDDWSTLSKSSLSEEQIADAITARIGHHARYRIPERNPDYMVTTMRNLWSGSIKEAVLPTLSTYADYATVGHRTMTSLKGTGAEVGEYVGSFLTNPANAAQVAELRRTFEIARKAIFSPDSVALSTFFKASQGRGEDPELEAYYQAHLAAYEERYRKTFGKEMQ